MLDKGVGAETLDSGADFPAAGDYGDRLAPLITFGKSISIIPHSGIQFIDFEFSGDALAGIRRRFLEESAGPDEPHMHVLHPIILEDNILFHPITREPLNIDDTTFVTGAQGLQPFLNNWVPVPLMRVIGTHEGGQLILDEGPANWARVYVTALYQPDGVTPYAYRAVLALDTAIGAESKDDDAPYLAPTPADVTLGSSFAFSDDADDVAWFVSEPWVDEWLHGLHAASKSAAVSSGPGGSKADDEELDHLSRYLTFLTALGSLCRFPQLRFVDTEAGAAHTPAIGVDLVLDIGNSRSFGVLIEQRDDEETLDLRGANILTLRDLSDPLHVYAEAFDSHVEFVPPPFGDPALSRQSGRVDAFYWPSFARVGAEAARLGARPGTGSGGTGISSPKRYLWDCQPRDDGWRFAGADAAGSVYTQRLSGPMLAYLSEDGDVLSKVKKSRGAAPPAIRPKFSRSSLLSFFLCEVILQAITQINSPYSRASRPKVNALRELRRITVTMPVGMPPEEHALLRDRLDGAIELVWQALGWSGEQALKVPPRPEVELGIDEAMCAQMVYLYDQVTRKFAGTGQDFLHLRGKSRPEYGVAPSLRVASIDIGAGATGLAVVTYAAGSNNTIMPTQQLRVGVHVGGDDVMEAVVIRHLIPAVEARLKACGMASAQKFLRSLLGGQSLGQSKARETFRKRFANQIASKAAIALINDYEERAAIAGNEWRQRSFGSLLGPHQEGTADVAREFDEFVAAEGVSGFCLRETLVVFRYDELSESIGDVLGSVLTDLSDIACAMDCDLCLLSGRSSSLPDVLAVLLARMPVRADRIIGMHNYHPGNWYPARNGSGEIGDAKTTVAAGALIHLLADGRLEDFRLDWGGAAPGAQMQRYIGRIDGDGQITPVTRSPTITADGVSAPEPHHRASAAGAAGTSSSGRLVVLELNEEAVFGGAPPSLASIGARVPAVLEPRVPAKTVPAADENNESIEIICEVENDQPGADEEQPDGHWLDTGVIASY